MALKDISGFMKDLAKIPADIYIEIEEKVSTKGLVLMAWTATICYMMVNNMVIPKSFGELYSIIIYAYFGVAAAKKLQELLPKKE